MSQIPQTTASNASGRHKTGKTLVKDAEPGQAKATAQPQVKASGKSSAKGTGKAVVVFSGGQDSTTCLAWALDRFSIVAAVTVDYGQRHRIELDAARRITALANVPHEIIPCDSFRALGGNSLTGDQPISNEPKDNLPSSFVPGRNLIFLTLAAAWGWQRGYHHLVTGVCQTDYSGYPDCRATTMSALQSALRAGLDAPVTIHTPLMKLSKAESIRLLNDLQHLDWLKDSHTCYRGVRPPCGTCQACVLRAKGFQEAGVADPLLNEV